IDLDHGRIAWQRAFGDLTEMRNNPVLQGVTLPAELGAPGVSGLIVTEGGLVFVGGGDKSLHAIDKGSGKDLWQGALSAHSSGTPMTYRTSAGHQFVVIAVGSGDDAELVAFSL